MNGYLIPLSSWEPWPDQRGQAEYHSADEMKYHTISWFNDLKYQRLGKQTPEKEAFLNFTEGTLEMLSFTCVCGKRKEGKYEETGPHLSSTFLPWLGWWGTILRRPVRPTVGWYWLALSLAVTKLFTLSCGLRRDLIQKWMGLPWPGSAGVQSGGYSGRLPNSCYRNVSSF